MLLQNGCILSNSPQWDVQERNYAYNHQLISIIRITGQEITHVVKQSDINATASALILSIVSSGIGGDIFNSELKKRNNTSSLHGLRPVTSQELHNPEPRYRLLPNIPGLANENG